MKKNILSAAILSTLIVSLCGCDPDNNSPSSTSSSSDGTSSSQSQSVSASVQSTDIESKDDETTDYNKLIEMPQSGGTYDYYSYGIFFSSTTVNDYSYTIGEQSSDQIRIDFEFTCTLNSMSENAAGSAANFFVVAYSKDGDKLEESIANHTANVGETVSFNKTILLDKSAAKNGIEIKFESNK